MWEPANDIERLRLEKLNQLREAGIEAYPPRVQRSHAIAEARRLFEAAEAAAGAGAEPETVLATLCGRVMAHRPKGKVGFADIQDGTGKVQVFARINTLGEEGMALFTELDLFDFIQVTGKMTRTKAGEMSIEAASMRLLAKSLKPLPVIKERELEDGTIERYGGFKETDSRYRERYADLAVNSEVREVFIARARTISAIRRFLDNEGMLEVETPILQPLYGGAAARPFVTHHNQLHQDLYLRISFELYLKRLLVGGIDAVYEIGRDFRNEGVSRKHNPEFTMLEFYKAYIDYQGVMDITERMVADACLAVNGGTQISWQGQEIDLTPPWARITLRDLIRQHTGIDYSEHPDRDSLAEAMRRAGKHPEETSSWGHLIDSLLSDIEPDLIQPVFVMDYPVEISPFAKHIPGDPTHVERFEAFMVGMEMANAFTELNDPLDQEERFLAMARMYGQEADEFNPIDEDYLNAMRYGMPPSGGFGMGIDRLVMLLTDRATIREVVLFPALRSREAEAGDA